MHLQVMWAYCATYFGTKVASNPCFLATALMTSRAKIKLSAALKQSVYLRAISNWPFPASACNCILKGDIREGIFVESKNSTMKYILCISIFSVKRKIL